MTSIQQLITKLEKHIENTQETIAYLKTQLPKDEVKPVEEKPKKETKKKEKPVEEKPKKETKKKEEKPVEEKPKEKNIPRFGASEKTLLANMLKRIAKLEIDNKIVDKFKKYINDDMTNAEFKAEGNLEGHIANFIRLNYPTKESVSPFAGNDDPPTGEWSNASEYPPLHKLQKAVSQEQFDAMKKSKILKPLGENNYWSPDDGMWILVDSDDDEVTEHEFNGETYFVCKSNKRVYQTDEKTDKDLFVGFVGIGHFKNMIV